MVAQISAEDRRLSVPSLPCVGLMKIAVITLLPHISENHNKISQRFDMSYLIGAIPNLLLTVKMKLELFSMLLFSSVPLSEDCCDCRTAALF